jgi:hypothetical protein
MGKIVGDSNVIALRFSPKGDTSSLLSDRQRLAMTGILFRLALESTQQATYQRKIAEQMKLEHPTVWRTISGKRFGSKLHGRCYLDVNRQPEMPPQQVLRLTYKAEPTRLRC